VHYSRGEFMAAVERYSDALDAGSAATDAAGSGGGSGAVEEAKGADGGERKSSSTPPPPSPASPPARLTGVSLGALLHANRSAAYFALGRPADMVHALADAQAAMDAAPGWPRGAFRRGIAERGLRRMASARKTLTVGALAAAAAAAEAVGTGAGAAAGAAAGVKAGGYEVRLADAFGAALAELDRQVAFFGEEDAVLPPAVPSVVAAAGAAAASTAAAAVESGGGAGDGDVFTSLETWLQSRGTSAFPSLFMQHYDEGSRGVHSRCDVAPETCVVSIGREFLITVEMARASPLGRKLAAARMDGCLSAAKHCYIAMFVLLDRQYVASLCFCL